MSKECPKDPNPKNVTCRNCEKLGHFSKDCTEKKNLDNVQCHTCNEMGHFSRDCPQRGGGTGGRACHNCESTEHLFRECPEKRKPRCFSCKQSTFPLPDTRNKSTD
jgi:hypothetical protein